MYKRKVGALALSVALASAICVPTVAFAAEEWDPGVTYGTPPENVTSPDGGGRSRRRPVLHGRSHRRDHRPVR